MSFFRKSLTILSLLAALVLAGCTDVKSGASYVVPNPQDVMMYQVNPRVFASEDSFSAVEERLDAIRELGTNVVWFMPIYPVGLEKAKNSPYCIRDYKGVNPEFGTLETFKSMVESCHERGMSVILDWVANHTSWDHPWITEHPDWYTRDDEGKMIPPAGTGWDDVADLDFDNQEMRLAMIDAMKFWVLEAGVDGFRCDAADYVPYDFWVQAVDSLRAIPDRKLLLLAEGQRKDHFDAGFEMNYSWQFLSALRRVFGRGASASTFFATDEREYDGIPEGCVKLRFTTNHDETAKMSPVQEFGNVRGSMSAFVITAYLHGGALIYGSQEVGYPEAINFFHYVPVDWNSNPELLKEYQKLMALYNKYPALRKGSMVPYPADDVLVFEKNSDKDSFLIIANVRNESVSAAIPETWNGVKVTDCMSGYETTLTDSMELGGYQYLILKK